MTSDSLLPSITTALCYVNIQYSYINPITQLTRQKLLLSPMFRLSTGPRTPPLPNSDTALIPLTQLQRELLAQIRPATVIQNHKGVKRIQPPVKYWYNFHSMTLLPEDDIDWMLFENQAVPRTSLWKWIWFFGAVWACVGIPGLRLLIGNVTRDLDSWWNSDLKLATEGALGVEEINRRRKHVKRLDA
ncbi:hypothetical protein HK096_006919 [Nowakowskiella sp. JEL0078]|nr:hypothetical protein HK096_006919 [Nowakowskiella sp. JEL0078]